MDSHDLLNIDTALVSRRNPARDNNGTLDIQRCARLHNYLVARGWMAMNNKQPSELHQLSSRPFYASFYGDQLAGIRHKLDPSLLSFLDSIILTKTREGDAYIFYWVTGIAEPNDLVDPEGYIGYDGEDETDEGLPRYLLLYHAVSELGCHALGLIYDQKRHRVAISMDIGLQDRVLPAEEYEDRWHPLETMLSNWIEMIHVGKVLPDPNESHGRWHAIDIWRWYPFSPGQVDSTVRAFDRLTAAIEARMSPSTLLDIDSGTPLFTSAELDMALVPEACFIRSLLTRIRTPRFTTIAPGLEVPHEKAKFAARQTFLIPHNDSCSSSEVDSNGDSNKFIPSVLVFAASGEQTASINKRSDRPFNPRCSANTTGAGLYSESLTIGSGQVTGDGFRLLLRFRLREWNIGHEHGAKTSSGDFVENESISGLFQHGFFSIGGDDRTQRMERLLDRWRELVEAGIWTVGEHGVEGTIETFKDADLDDSWRHYWIPPSW
ncbi:hypothetical protein FQN49_006344 [Arthroderma sp. PD_2]|nr:hypothetical protein FQN49_006344 [Arthroderma sp. PD_2]